MNSVDFYISPGLPDDLNEGFSTPNGVNPPLTPAQKNRVKAYGAKAVWTGAAAAGIVAVGTIVVIAIGKKLLGMGD